MKLKYKALMLDVDGTLIPYDYEASPSKKVCEAIKKAQKYLPVTLVTGRSYSAIEDFLQQFEIRSGFAVTNGGAVVVDIKSKEVIYKKPISTPVAEEIIKTLRAENITFYLKSKPLQDMWGTPFSKIDTFTDAYMILAEELYSEEKLNKVFGILSKFPVLSLHKTKHFHPDKYGFTMTHVEATKLHGIEVVMKKLDLERKDIIGVGDSYNDFPLLMASGLKVAMGNAIPELKAVADYVAPDVTEDGVAHVIDRFILES